MTSVRAVDILAETWTKHLPKRQERYLCINLLDINILHIPSGTEIIR
jgi:hypothetical protein